MSIFDGNLKQRLIGAVVVIVLAVVFLPMIFNNKGEKLPETVVTVPLEPTKPAQPATQLPPAIVTPTSEPTTTTSEPIQPEQPIVDNNTTNSAAPTTAATTPEATVTTPITGSNTATTTTPTNPVVSQPNAQGITPSWTVQVAAGSNLQNAETFTNKLRQANYNAYIRSEGNMHRVFVGPFIEKAEAARVQKSIEKQFKEKGFVTEFKPEKK
ncbi:SPOR domain-containing protein [Entomomonas asaccharolytica]|uniref:SPOR domain-containing protein n=1 Tax=Entomomonas asaccharolytica TaxID=2785331 RepID=A0A974ND40_9GAMM|nr:SPOR domain-containing protein [Entomomonas asaccharolytica]QQP84481.1 SPOR domain-containing protein [Entomomonas asaccharolytica]